MQTMPAVVMRYRVMSSRQRSWLSGCLRLHFGYLGRCSREAHPSEVVSSVFSWRAGSFQGYCHVFYKL